MSGFAGLDLTSCFGVERFKWMEGVAMVMFFLTEEGPRGPSCPSVHVFFMAFPMGHYRIPFHSSFLLGVLGKLGQLTDSSPLLALSYI